MNAHTPREWNKFRTCAMEQDCLPGKISCVWTSNRDNLYLPIPAFQGRTWLEQTRKEAQDQGAELHLSEGNWYVTWPLEQD